MDLDDLMDKIYTAYEEAGTEPNVPVKVDCREIMAVRLNYDRKGSPVVEIDLVEKTNG